MEVALGVGSLVVLAGGLAALIRREIRPGQALMVLGIAAGVGLVALLAGWLAENRLGAFYRFAIVAPTTLAGIAMAVMAVTRPRQRRP